MVFQDVLQINTRLIDDPLLAKIARHHLAEDSGHDRWFLNDLLAIDGKHPSVSELFSKNHKAIRYASYQLMSEIHREQTDKERIVLLLALESAGHVFFERIVDFFEKHKIYNSLKYFSRFHLDAEKSHEMFERELEETLAAIELPVSLRHKCIALVDRCYAAFVTIFDELDSTVEESAVVIANLAKERESILIANESSFKAPARRVESR